MHSLKLVSEEKQSSSHLRELKARSHNFTTVSKSRPSLGAVKEDFKVVVTVGICSMLVAGRVVEARGFISSELAAQEVKIRDTATVPKSFFIL